MEVKVESLTGKQVTEESKNSKKNVEGGMEETLER